MASFTPREQSEIEHAVAEAEKRTRAEIVVVTVEESDQYLWVHLFCALCGWLLVTVFAVWQAFKWRGWPFDPIPLLLSQTAGMLVGLLLSFLPSFRRAIIPPAVIAETVHRRVLANFVAAGLTETRERTGVLVFLSFFEHRVEILADKGINDRVPPGYWQERVAQIVTGMRERRGAKAVAEAVAAIGDLLAEQFPPRPDDTDELSNSVRTGV